jgi:hypothetical protein
MAFYKSLPKRVTKTGRFFRFSCELCGVFAYLAVKNIFTAKGRKEKLQGRKEAKGS